MADPKDHHTGHEDHMTFSRAGYYFPMAAVTNHPKQRSTKQHKFIM